MSEEIKNLSESVNKLIAEYRATAENDAENTAKLKNMEADFIQLKEAVAAANAPKFDICPEDQAAKYKEAFGAYLYSGDRAGVRDGSDLRVKDLSLNVATEGGVFLPKVFSGEMTELLRKSSAIRARARVIRSGQNFVHPIKLTQGTADVRAEKGTIASSSGQTFNLLTFNPLEINARQSATAWAHDGDAQVSLVNMVMTDIAGAIGEKEGDFFLNSTNQNALSVGGGNIKTGLLTGTKLVSSVDRFTNTVGSLAGVNVATAGAVNFDDVMNLRSTLHGKYLPKAVYIMNAATELELLKLKDSNNRYLITNGDVVNGIPGRILGNEYIVEDNMADSGTTGAKIALVDLSTYYVIDHSDFRWISNPLTDYSMVEYFAGRRTAGALTDHQAIRVLYNKAS